VGVNPEGRHDAGNGETVSDRMDFDQWMRHWYDNHSPSPMYSDGGPPMRTGQGAWDYQQKEIDRLKAFCDEFVWMEGEAGLAWSDKFKADIDHLTAESKALREALKVRLLGWCDNCESEMDDEFGGRGGHEKDCPHYATEKELESNKEKT